MTIGKRLFWSVLSLFFIFAVLFIVFQQMREKEFKIDMLNLKLQDYNERMHESLDYIGNYDENTL
ncbi:MAG: histidine kinase, partial [Prevotella sp.]|nr:histidine kinase [Prevotella sp.]